MNRITSAFKVLVLISLMVFSWAISCPVDSIEKGIELFQSENYADAKQFFLNYIKENGEHSDAFYYMGRIYFQENDLKEAVDWFEKSVALDRNSSRNYHWLAIAYGQRAQEAGLLKKAGLAKKMKKAIDRAIELDPDNIDARFVALQYYAYAPGIMGGDDNTARMHATEIKKRDVKYGYAAFIEIYRHNEEYDLLELELRQRLEQFSEEIAYQNELAWFCHDHERYDEAFNIFENLIKAHPEQMDGYYQVGRTASVSGQRLDRGRECLEYFIANVPEEERTSPGWVHYRLGLIYAHQSDKEAARMEYEKALERNPDFKEAKKALKKLK
jgi:tetratricopeptide (TPR) repeat protein